MKIKTLVNIVLSFLIFVFLLEIVGLTFWSIKNEKILSAKTLFQQQPEFIGDFAKKNECSWSDFVAPHPHFAIYYHEINYCKHPSRNNWGLAGQDIPSVKDTKFYNVLLLGASVAESLTIPNYENGVSILESKLNKRYQSPNGRPFKIINGSVAAANHPIELNMFLILYRLADAVITVEGYNEHFRYKTDFQLYEPPQIWFDIMKKYSGSLSSLFRSRIYSFFSWLIGTPLKYSYGAYSSYVALTNLAIKLDLNKQTSVYPNWPEKFSLEKKSQEYINQYVGQLKNLYILARENNLPIHIFFQPYPGKYKKLTAEEVAQSKWFLSTYPKYDEMSESVISQLPRHFPVTSLKKIFQNNTDKIYTDHIHVNELGKEILVSKILETLELKWKLKRVKL